MKFQIGDAVDAAAELESLLSYNGFRYRKTEDTWRFWFSDRGMKWETACVCHKQAVLLYGIYPFGVKNRKKAEFLCNDINRQVLFGSMFLTDDAVVFRTCADLFDGYSAYEAIGRALEYNANVICEFWQKMAGIAQEEHSLPQRAGEPPV